jgi:hypothetical protein
LGLFNRSQRWLQDALREAHVSTEEAAAVDGLSQPTALAKEHAVLLQRFQQTLAEYNRCQRLLQSALTAGRQTAVADSAGTVSALKTGTAALQARFQATLRDYNCSQRWLQAALQMASRPQDETRGPRVDYHLLYLQSLQGYNCTQRALQASRTQAQEAKLELAQSQEALARSRALESARQGQLQSTVAAFNATQRWLQRALRERDAMTAMWRRDLHLFNRCQRQLQHCLAPRAAAAGAAASLPVLARLCSSFRDFNACQRHLRIALQTQAALAEENRLLADRQSSESSQLESRAEQQQAASTLQLQLEHGLAEARDNLASLQAEVEELSSELDDARTTHAEELAEQTQRYLLIAFLAAHQSLAWASRQSG